MLSKRHSLRNLFLQVLGIVFIAELAVMLILPWVLPQQTPETLGALADSCLLTLVSAPWLWWSVVRPLQRVAALEQAKAAALGAATTHGMITFNNRGVVQSFNLPAENIFGFAAAEIIGDSLDQILPWQFLTRQTSDAGRSQTGPQLLQGTVRITGQHKNGSGLPLALTVGEVRVEDEVMYTAVVRNLVDRERDEQRAEQMAAVAQLGTSFAHRLRNPLTSIKMLVQACGRGNGAITLEREDLRVMEDEVRRMERSLQMFLDFARPPKLQPQPVDLVRMTAEIVAAMQPRAWTKQTEIHFAPPPRCEAAGDPRLLAEVIQNLIQNAVDAATPPGRVEVELVQGSDFLIELRVNDNGPGISAEVLPRLFQPFVTTKATGVGLGLVLARRIAEEHGGSLAGCNREEGGASFVLSLSGLAAT